MADGLAAGSVRDFLARVASADEPVPAGGSVAALTGAASAALLALVCSVQLRKQPGSLAGELERAQRLQAELLALVDEDAAAFRAYLDAKRAQRHGQHPDLEGAVSHSTQTPLRIAAACSAVLELSGAIGGRIQGMTLGDVQAAAELARAAKSAALGLVGQDVA